MKPGEWRLVGAEWTLGEKRFSHIWVSNLIIRSDQFLFQCVNLGIYSPCFSMRRVSWHTISKSWTAFQATTTLLISWNKILVSVQTRGWWTSRMILFGGHSKSSGFQRAGCLCRTRLVDPHCCRYKKKKKKRKGNMSITGSILAGPIWNIKNVFTGVLPR